MAHKLYTFDEVAKALRDMRLGGGMDPWTGPNQLHHSVGATNPEPSWHFSPEGLAYHEERGRDFLEVVILIAFQLGFHNGAVQRDQYFESMQNWADSAGYKERR